MERDKTLKVDARSVVLITSPMAFEGGAADDAQGESMAHSRHRGRLGAWCRRLWDGRQNCRSEAIQFSSALLPNEHVPTDHFQPV